MRTINADDCEKYFYEHLDDNNIAGAMNAINEMPTVEPERKTGTWQRKYSRPGVYADLCWHCSICGGKFSDTYANMWKYCPDCGAKMEGEQ